jgi:hypothetical protein
VPGAVPGGIIWGILNVSGNCLELLMIMKDEFRSSRYFLSPLVFGAGLILFFFGIGPRLGATEAGTEIFPHDIATLRRISGQTYLLPGLATINGPTDSDMGDRTIVHFELTSTPQIVTSARLVFDFTYYESEANSLGDRPGVIDLYGFFGDGNVSTDEWNEGSLLISQIVTATGNSQSGTAEFDLTSFLQSANSSSAPFASFDLRRGNDSGPFSIPVTPSSADIRLYLVPEPQFAWLAVTVGGVFRCLGRCRSELF